MAKRCIAVVAGEIGFVEIWLPDDDRVLPRTYGFFARPAMLHRLSERRQTLTLPASHRETPGWVGIPVDLPPPPPMPTGDDATRIIVRCPDGTHTWWCIEDHPIPLGYIVVCTVTVGVDADGNPTASAVQP